MTSRNSYFVILQSHLERYHRAVEITVSFNFSTIMYMMQRWQLYETKIHLLDLLNTSNSFAY